MDLFLFIENIEKNENESMEGLRTGTLDVRASEIEIEIKIKVVNENVIDTRIIMEAKIKNLNIDVIDIDLLLPHEMIMIMMVVVKVEGKDDLRRQRVMVRRDGENGKRVRKKE